MSTGEAHQKLNYDQETSNTGHNKPEDGAKQFSIVPGEPAGNPLETPSDNPSGDELEAVEARNQPVTSNSQPSDPPSSQLDSAALTPDEEERYLADLKTIRKGVAVFYEVGKALERVKDGKLYRSDYPTWDKFCKAELANSTRHADRCIESAKIVEDLLDGESDKPFIEVLAEVENALPKNEAQARPLKRLKTREERKKAWSLVQQKARERSQPITAEIIIEAVNEVSPKKVKTEPKPKSDSKAKASPTKSQDDAGPMVPKPLDQMVESKSVQEDEAPPKTAERIEVAQKATLTVEVVGEEFADAISGMCMELNKALDQPDLDAAREIVRRMSEAVGEFYRKAVIAPE